VLERFLERHGYRVLSAGSAESAYEILSAEAADALLLDIHLPTCRVSRSIWRSSIAAGARGPYRDHDG